MDSRVSVRSAWAVPAAALLSAAAANGQNYDRYTTQAPPTWDPVQIRSHDVAPSPGGGCLVVGAASPGVLAATRFNASADAIWEAHYAIDEPLGAIHSVQPTADGGYILAAGIQPTYPVPCVPMGTRLIKINANGQTQWAWRFPGEGQDIYDIYKPGPVVQVREAPDGGFVAVATLRVRDPQNGCTDKCFFNGVLIRTDARGSVLFVRSYQDDGAGAKSRLTFADVEADEEGIVILATAETAGTCDKEDIAAVLIRTDWNGQVTSAFTIDRVAPGPDCGSPPCHPSYWWEYASSLRLRDGIAYLGANLAMAHAGDQASLIAAVDPDTGAWPWAWVHRDLWVAYSSMRFDFGGKLLVGGRVYGNLEFPTMLRLEPASGAAIWQWNYKDPRPLSDPRGIVEGVAANPAGATFWGVLADTEFGGNELYLIGTDTAGWSECSTSEPTSRPERAVLKVTPRKIESYKELRGERWSVDPKYVPVKTNKPCSE